MLAGGEITPEGDLYTGWAEYELLFGRALRPWDQPTRILPDPGLPELSSALSDGPVVYRETVFAVAVGGRPVAYDTVRVVNRSSRAQVARLAMGIAYTRGRQLPGAHGTLTGAYRYERPVTDQPLGYYSQPGQPFSTAFVYSTGGRDLVRSGLLLARGPAAPSRSLGAPAGRAPGHAPGGVRGRVHADARSTVHDSRLFAVRLGPHHAASFTWQIPLEPPAAGSAADRQLDAVPPTAARSRLRRGWREEEASMMRISLPERRVVAAYEAAIVEMLQSRYLTAQGWAQASNKLQYQAVWLRDAALETQALDLAGLHSQASANLAFLDGFQRADGLFISRPGQYDGLGQALWALAEHAQLTRDPSYAAAQLGRMQKAIDWLWQATLNDPLGLLPASDPGDDELAYGHITGDDVWTAAGLRSAVADAALAGRADLAAGWRAVDERFEASLRRAASAAVARAGHLPPVLDAVGGQDWGNYGAAYPVEVLAARSPAVQATLEWAQRHMSQGLPTYYGGQSLHDYLGFALFQTGLEAGDVSDAIAGLYAELAHTTSTLGGWEWNVSPLGFRGTPTDMAPHGAFAADYVSLLRNMLVGERAKSEIRLLAGASPAWLAPGKRVAVSGASTAYGSVSFVERSSPHKETLTWHASLAPGARLTWALPAWARHVRVSGGRLLGVATVAGRAGDAGRWLVALPASSGSISATFAGWRPRRSYAMAVASLNRFYRRHGRAAPLVRMSALGYR